MLSNRPRRAIPLVVVGAALVAALVGCAAGRKPPAAASATPAARISATTLTGGHVEVPVRSAAVTVVNLWASWCAPCQTETPVLVRAARQAALQHVAFVGLDERDDPAAARAFARAHGVGYPIVADPQGLLAAKIPGVPASALPVTLVLDAAGHVRWRHAGAVTDDQLRRAIRAASAVASTAG